MDLKGKAAIFKSNEPYVFSDGSASIPFLKLIPLYKKRVLVIGCGEGQEVVWLNRHGFQTTGVTNNLTEVKNGVRKFHVDLQQRDMHDLHLNARYDAIFANQVLEHSTAPFLALLHWRNYLKKEGYLVIGMPSREWIPEHYHFSVLTHSQMKDLLYKAGYKLLAGPEMKSNMALNGGNIFIDLGRSWGHQDAYVAEKTNMPKERFMLGNLHGTPPHYHPIHKLIRAILKYPYNKVRIWQAGHHRE